MMKSITMPATKLLCSSLLLANSLLTESRLLSQWEGMPENPTPCLTADECREKFLSLNTGGYFYVIERPYKGCMMKNANGYFASGGTVEQMSTTYLPGIQERIWCGKTWEAGEEDGSMSFGFDDSMSLTTNEFGFDIDLSLSMSMSVPVVDALPEPAERVSLDISSVCRTIFHMYHDLCCAQG